MAIGQNLVEQQYELENVPMNTLMSMAERPDGLFPQYLVLTELERRNREKNSYDMQKASMEGDTTVAQDLIMSSSETPAGIDALGTPPPLSNQSVDPAGGITQMMASGGAVRRYANGGDTLSDEEVNYIASNSLGQISEPMGDGGFGTTYPEIRSSVFGNDNNIENLGDIEDVNQLEKLYRAYSKKNLSRADLGRIHNRTMDLVTQIEGIYDPKEYNLTKDIFKFGSNEEYVDNYITKYYPEYTGDKEGIRSLIRKSSNSGGYGNDEYDKIYDTLQGYRGEENLRLQDQYRTQEYPILEEALQKKIREKELEFMGPDSQTGEIDRVESMIPNLISRTDQTGAGIELIRKMYPNMGDHQIEELMENIPDLRMTEIEANLEKDFMLHGGPLVNPSTGKVDYFNEEGKFNTGGSVYSNPYFGDADPEEVKKLQEKMPGLSTEDAVAIILGIDTSDVTKGFAKGGIARFNQGQTVDRSAAFSYGAPIQYQRGRNDLPGADETIQRENAEAAKVRASQLLSDLEAQYGFGNIPRRELEKIDKIIKEADAYGKAVEQYDVESYEADLLFEELGGGVAAVPETILQEQKKEEEQKNQIAQAIAENNSPDLLAEEMKRYAGILGLPDEEERKRDKTTAMLLGLGSSISNATDLGDISKSFPSIFNTMQGIDKQGTKDKMGILNLLATQQKTNTLSRKDKLTVIQKRIEDLRKELEQPAITGGRTPEDIQKEIADLRTIINQATGVGRKTMTGGDILQAKKYVGG